MDGGAWWATVLGVAESRTTEATWHTITQRSEACCSCKYLHVELHASFIMTLNFLASQAGHHFLRVARFAG